MEQTERLALVFVERIFLGIGAQADALAEVIQRQQVVFPQLIQDGKIQALFHIAHDLGAILGNLFRHFSIGGGGDAFEYFGFGDAFFLGPLDERQI